MKNIGITTICMTPMKACHLLDAHGHHHAERGDAEGEQQLQGEDAEDSVTL